MAYVYRPRGMPARFMKDAPAAVRAGVLDLIAIKPAAPLDFDVLLSAPVTDVETGEVYGYTGVDFGAYGMRGQPFHLNPHALRAYRERYRRNRVSWTDLPKATQAAVLAYLRKD